MSDCPFDIRLNRTPYLVLPKLAIQAMPIEWRNRLEAMLEEMESAGIETPAYHVFRADPPVGIKGCKQVNKGKWDQEPFYRLTGGWQGDPWANYRHGNALALSKQLQSEASA